MSVSDPDGTASNHFRYSVWGENAVSDPFGGSLHMDRYGNWHYAVDNSNAAVQRLAAGEEGHATYRVSSADGTSHQIQITIHGTNDVPVLSAATASATEDGSAVTGQMSATDVDTGDTLSFAPANPVPGFTLGTDGSWSFDPTDAAYQHLAAGATQQVTIPVTVTDKAGATDTEHLVITVTGTNDGPAVSAPVTLPAGTEDKPVQITAAQLLGHATDIDTGDVLSVTGLSASHGTISGDAAHGFTFTPDPNYNGPVALNYTVTDGHGGAVAQTASLTLAATGDAAVIGGVDTGDVTEDVNVMGMQWLQTRGQLTIADPDTGEARFVMFPMRGSYPTSLGGNASLVIGPKGGWIYDGDNDDPRVQALGAGQTLVDTVTVRSADGTTHQIQITIHGTNDVPVLSAATASATEDGSAVTGQMSATDVDTGDTLSFAPANPVPGFTLGTDGSWSFDPTDAAYQHLAAGATQQVTIPVTVTDKAGATDTEHLVITVTGTNDGPAVSAPVTLPAGTEDKPVQITAAQLLEHATDIDTGDTLSVTGLSASHGSISGDAAHGFTFTPDPNYNGPVSLSYQVTDGHGGTVAQTAALTLAATGDAAVIGGVDTGDVTENTAGVDKSPDQHEPGIATLGKAPLYADGKLT
ncbi:VCBS domain-containing protein, partial [Falsiruegeria litorea]|uniref:VCBS domain-containing protein n=1 Tax=Falsiruegeria litorea TaxID=1280831 RepID=UPI0013FD8A45